MDRGGAVRFGSRGSDRDRLRPAGPDPIPNPDRRCRPAADAIKPRSRRIRSNPNERIDQAHGNTKQIPVSHRRLHLLKRRYKLKADRNATRLSVLKAVVYGICHEDTTREHANQALSRFKDEFFDWNEVRVSGVEEIQESLAGIPEPEERAQHIRRFLRQLFNRTYGFTLDALAKKPLKEALKVLQTYEAFSSDYVTATVIQQALGGHAIPIDKDTHRALSGWGSPSRRPGPPRRAGACRPQEPRRRIPRPDRGPRQRHLHRRRAGMPPLRAAQDLPVCPGRKNQDAADAAAARTAKPRAAKEKPPEPARAAPRVKAAEAASPAPAKKAAPARSAKEPPPAPKPSRGKHEPSSELEALLKPENKDKLVAILKSHVIPAWAIAAHVVGLKREDVKAAEGSSARITVKDGTVTIDDAKVIRTDIDCTNGVIQRQRRRDPAAVRAVIGPFAAQPRE